MESKITENSEEPMLDGSLQIGNKRFIEIVW